MSPKSAPKHPPKKPEARPRRDAFLKASLCALVCLWMFVLGILVGRGTAPIRFNIERLQDKLAGLKAATVDETTQHYQVAFQELDQKMDLGFHEALKNEDTEIPSTLSSAPETPRKQAEPQQADTPDTKPETPVPKKTKTATIRKTETEPDSQKPEAESGATGTWTIQVAATRDEAQGKKLLLNLYQMGFKAYLTKVAIPDKGTWYRVRIGGYTSREAAESVIGDLEEKRFSPMIIAP